MPDELLEAEKSIKYGIEYIEQAYRELVDLLDGEQDDEHQMPGLLETLNRLLPIIDAMKAILEPLAPIIKAAHELREEEERWNPN